MTEYLLPILFKCLGRYARWLKVCVTAIVLCLRRYVNRLKVCVIDTVHIFIKICQSTESMCYRYSSHIYEDMPIDWKYVIPTVHMFTKIRQSTESMRYRYFSYARVQTVKLMLRIICIVDQNKKINLGRGIWYFHNTICFGRTIKRNEDFQLYR
jgi:hypothetical protein